MSDENTSTRRRFLTALAGLGVAGGVGGVMTGKIQRSAKSAGVGGPIRRMAADDAPAEDVIEWSLAGSRDTRALRTDYHATFDDVEIGTDPVPKRIDPIDDGSFDVAVEETADRYSVDIHADTRFREADSLDEVRDRSRALAEADPDRDVDYLDFFGRNFPEHRDATVFLEYVRPVDGVFDAPRMYIAPDEDQVVDKTQDAALKMMRFPYNILETGTVGVGDPAGIHGSAGIAPVDTSRWAEEYEGKEPGEYRVVLDMDGAELAYELAGDDLQEAMEEPHAGATDRTVAASADYTEGR